MHAKQYRFNVVFTFVLVLSMMAAALPAATVHAQEPSPIGQTLQVAAWSGPDTLANVGGRPTVVFDGAVYHLWYSAKVTVGGLSQTALFYTSSPDPVSFPAGTQVTGLVANYQQSPAVVIEGGTFTMINYGSPDEKTFNLYTSTDGVNWTDQGPIYTGADLSDWMKIDAPTLLKDETGYKLYFQVKSSLTGNPYSIYLATTADLAQAFTLANGGAPVLSPSAVGSDWDGLRLQHPMVVKDGGQYYMWYAAYGTGSSLQKIGFASSPDGVVWTKGRGNPVIGSTQQSAEPSVVKVGDTWHIWFLRGANILHYAAPGYFQFSTLAAALAAAAEGDTIKVASGSYAQAGGFNITKPGLTISLPTGTVIQNASPCFTVSASHVRILAETIGGAKCVPTGGAPGIDVAAGVTDLVIDGLEIDGTGQTTGSGIYFQGAIADVQILNSFIHDLGGDGITFTAAPTGVVQIQGNFFKNEGISSPAAINAAYNSWGSYIAPTIPNVTTSSNTHVALSATPAVAQVFADQSVTFSVKGDLKNVAGADFSLTYPADLLTLTGATPSTLFEAVDGQGLMDTTQAGKISFHGYAPAGVSGEGQELFQVTFTAKQTGVVGLSFDDATDAFAMAPDSGPSTYIYAAGLTSQPAAWVSRPSLSSADLGGNYLAGVQQEFHVTLANPADGGTFSHVLVKFHVANAALSDITSIEYWEGEGTTPGWFALPLTTVADGLDGYYGPSTGFPLVPGYSATSLFRVTFGTAKAYPVTLSLVTVPASEDLATMTATATVSQINVTGTVSMQGRTTRAGVPVKLSGASSFTVDSIDQMSNNITFSAVGGTYTIQTDQPRYLNVSGTLTLTQSTVLPAIELKGGDVDGNGGITVGDASLIGTDYGQADITLAADVNYSGKVDIFDLALVGGNFGDTEAIYGAWPQ